MRLKDKAKKVISRVWLQPEQDWIKNVEAKEVERPGTPLHCPALPLTTNRHGCSNALCNGLDRISRPPPARNDRVQGPGGG